MGQQKNAKLIRRKIRQELRPVHQGLYNLANGLMQHIQDKDIHIQKQEPAVADMDKGLVTKQDRAETD